MAMGLPAVGSLRSFSDEESAGPASGEAILDRQVIHRELGA